MVKRQIKNQTINIKDVEVSEVTKDLFNYSNREGEIKALVDSISSIGQQHAITIMKNCFTNVVIDSVLMLCTLIRLNLNELDETILTMKLVRIEFFEEYIQLPQRILCDT